MLYITNLLEKRKVVVTSNGGVTTFLVYILPKFLLIIFKWQLINIHNLIFSFWKNTVYSKNI